MAEQTFEYYVVYVYGQNGTFGHGCMNLARERPIQSFEDVRSIAKLVEAESDARGVTVLNWKRID